MTLQTACTGKTTPEETTPEKANTLASAMHRDSSVTMVFNYRDRHGDLLRSSWWDQEGTVSSWTTGKFHVR